MKRLALSALFLTLASPRLYSKTLDTCFSPLGHCDQVMVSWIDAAETSLDGAIYGLTDDDIAQAFLRAKNRGVRVRLVHDKTQAAGKNDDTSLLQAAGIEVHVQRGSEGGILHHKFLIIDSSYVITGSFNWTNNATSKNDENFVILDDQTPKFMQEFERLWARPAAPPSAQRSRQKRSPSNSPLKTAEQQTADQPKADRHTAEQRKAGILKADQPTTDQRAVERKEDSEARWTRINRFKAALKSWYREIH